MIKIKIGGIEMDVKKLKESVNIVDVIGSYVDLQKKGRNYVGICPFHNDTNPSLYVSEEKQTYTCFACHAHGDVIKFVMDIEEISFPAACRKIAAFAGMSEAQMDAMRIGVTRSDPLRKLHSIMNEAQKIYAYYMHTKSAQAALNYLYERGISDDVIKAFGIGYAPGRILSEASKKNPEAMNRSDMISLGLLNEKGNDRFSDRIIFPIRDRYGKVAGFSGRAYHAGETPKYMNSQETPTFHKREILYNFDRASAPASKSGSLILCEGFMDVIAFYRAGMKNAAALMGTALTSEHLSMIGKAAIKNITVCLDGDRAGLNAAFKNAMILSDAGFAVHVCVLPDGKDPDEFLKSDGAEALSSRIRSAMPLVAFRMRMMPRATFDEKKQLVEESAQLSKKLKSDMIEAESYAALACHLTGLPKDSVYATFGIRMQSKDPILSIRGFMAENRQLECQLLKGMMYSHKVLDFYVSTYRRFNFRSYDAIAKAIVSECGKAGHASAASIMSHLSDRDAEIMKQVMRSPANGDIGAIAGKLLDDQKKIVQIRSML